MKVFLCLLFFTHVHAVDQRLQAHQQTVDEFLKLNFFTNGRGMHLTPNFVSVYEKLRGKIPHSDEEKGAGSGIMTGRWGFNEVDGHPVGLHHVTYKKMDIGVLGCVACHSGKAAGKFIVGLGNKNIDPAQVGKDLVLIQKIWQGMTIFTPKTQEYRRMEKQALKFAGKIKNDNISNLTQGHVTTSIIRQWFYDIHGEELPPDMRRGAVKVPMLWGYGLKRRVGQFADGFGDGEMPGWGIAVELIGGQTVATARGYMDKIEHAEVLLEDLLPPAYPFKLDQNKVSRGKILFEQSCTSCHGTYQKDENGYPIFQAPKHIAWSAIQTDRDRLMANTEQFVRLVESSPLNDYLKHTGLKEGYFAPRLEGIWARFPYLHNAAVPTLADLLEKPKNRPKFFSLKEAGEEHRFNQQKVGLTVPKAGTKAALALKKSVRQQKRWVFDTERIGHSNQGHYFSFLDDWSKDQKQDLIEYLKSL